MELTEKTLSQEYHFRGRIINLREDKAQLPDGKIVTREVVEHPGGVCVVALTPQDEILLVRQFRYPYSQVLWEVPAGKLEPGEDPEVCGLRELREETGALAQRLQLMCRMYPTPGYCGEIIHIYWCRVSDFGDCMPDEDEYLQWQAVPLKEALEMVLSGEIPDAKTQIAVLRAARMLEQAKGKVF